jgi:hypothetical protein
MLCTRYSHILKKKKKFIQLHILLIRGLTRRKKFLVWSTLILVPVFDVPVPIYVKIRHTFLFLFIIIYPDFELLVSDESDDPASAGALLSTLDLQAQNVASEDTVGGGGRYNS